MIVRPTASQITIHSSHDMPSNSSSTKPSKLETEKSESPLDVKISSPESSGLCRQSSEASENQQRGRRSGAEEESTNPTEKDSE